jgi:coenzyme F420-reducing hydrogenase beta subunit
VNALADVVVGAFDRGAPWVVVRNRAGRALLDTMDADIVCSAVDAPGASPRLSAVRARVMAPVPARPVRPEVMP